MSVADKPIEGKPESSDDDRIELIPPYEWDDERLKAATEKRRKSVRELFKAMGWEYEPKSRKK